MKLIEKILLATDFSKASENAKKMAMSLAKKLKSEIILIHVMPDGHAFKLAEDLVRSTAEKYLGEMGDEITANGIKLGDTILTAGSPFDKINHYARLKDVNLIMMGAGNRESTTCFPLGITAQQVIRKSAKPAWIVKPDASPEIRRILCPVDFSAPSRLALNSAIHLTQLLEAELIVMTALEPMAKYQQSSHEEYAEQQRNEFEEFLAEFDLSFVSWSKEIREGEVHREILHALSANDADLLIMGSTGRTGLSRILLGSVTEKVIREVPCSMLIEKSEDAIRLRVDSDIDDLETHLMEGKSLLENGYYHEALLQFKLCLDIDSKFIPAWEAAAIVYEKLGNQADADNSRQQAKEIRDRLWAWKVEADIRSRHSLFGKKKKPTSM